MTPPGGERPVWLRKSRIRSRGSETRQTLKASASRPRLSVGISRPRLLRVARIRSCGSEPPPGRTSEGVRFAAAALGSGTAAATRAAARPRSPSRRPAAERSEKPPSIDSARRRMLRSPCPAPSAPPSKPTPSSGRRPRAARRAGRSSPRRVRAPAWWRALARPSWTIRKTSICSSGASRTSGSISSSTSSSPVGGQELHVAAQRRVERRRAAGRGEGEHGEARLLLRRRRRPASAAAATRSSDAPASSMLTCVEIAKRYCARPSWMSRATRARSSATARPNSAYPIARQTPTSRTP